MLRAITNVLRALTVYRLQELTLTKTANETLPATFEPDDLLRTSSKTSKNLEVSSRFHFRHGSFPPIGPRPRSDEHAKCTDRSSDQSQEEGSPSIRTRAQLMRPRLQSPAGRRNSSAESPGPSNCPTLVAHYPALQQTVQQPHTSPLHKKLSR